MKKIIIICLLSLMSTVLMGITTASSLPFSNSYLQRATGVEANYWNPATLHNLQARHEILFLPFTFRADNNAISLSLYNKVSGQFLDEQKKNDILDSIDGSVKFGMSVNAIIFGYANRRWALSSATNFFAKGKIDKNYLELLLMGNEYNRSYVFTTENNNFAMLAYQDFTFSYGGILLNKYIPQMKDLDMPDVYMGLGISALVGAANVEMYKFDGVFTASDDGLSLNQKATVRTGSLGTGYKLSWGLSSDVLTINENQVLSAGLTINNILGTIKWTSNTEKREYIAVIDSVYMNKLDDDIFKDDEIVTKIGDYSTELPLSFKMGLNYRVSDFSFSMDYAQNSKAHNAFSSDPKLSFGAEYDVVGIMPIQLGYRMPIGDLPSLYSVGLGLRFKYYEFGFGYQSVGALFTDSTKGVAFSGQMKFRF